jgi:hypothetical protein
MCPVVQNARSVFAPVTVLAFPPAQFESCGAFLSARTADTERVPLADAGQLIMAADGRIAETGYRFNAIGFAAVANALMPGLVGVFNDLSGEARNRHIESADSGELAAAVSIYNTALRSRFETMRERVLLVDHRAKTIDGCLSIEHKMLDNAAFYSNIFEELTAAQPNARFHRAEVTGRELRVYYLDAKSRRTDIYQDPRHLFAGGWYFSNREDAGLALRATNCLFTKFGSAVGAKNKSSHMRHIGADFFGRAAVLIRGAANLAIDMHDVAKAVQRINAISLNFSEDRAAFNKTVQHWCTYLAQFKIGRDAARHICRNAAVVGCDISPRSPVEAYMQDTLASRTLYDLFCATLRYSKNQYHTIRDLLQGAAMQMLFPPQS